MVMLNESDEIRFFWKTNGYEKIRNVKKKIQAQNIKTKKLEEFELCHKLRFVSNKQNNIPIVGNKTSADQRMVLDEVHYYATPNSGKTYPSPMPYCRPNSLSEPEINLFWP